MLVSPATEEVSRAWNLQKDMDELLDELLEMLKAIQVRLSKARTDDPGLDKLKTKATEALAYINKHESEVKRVNRHMILDYFNPFKYTFVYRYMVARKIKSFQVDLDKIFERRKKLEENLVLLAEEDSSPVVQTGDIRRTPPVSEIVARDDDISNPVRTVSDQNSPSGGPTNHIGMFEFYGLSDEENIEKAVKAKLCENSGIKQLVLSWRVKKGERGERKDGGYIDDDVMKKLESHPNLKELTVEGFLGMKPALWINKMANLVTITLKDCNKCEVLPPLGHLPQLRILEIVGMKNVKGIGNPAKDTSWTNHILPKLKEWVEAVTSTGARRTLYPSLTKLKLSNLPKLEEWEEGATRGNGQSEFPKLESFKINNCPKLRKIPKSCFPSLKKLSIGNSESSMILESISENVSSLETVKLGGGIPCRSSTSHSRTESIINMLLRNNSLSLTKFDLIDCKDVQSLTLGVSVEKLWVYNCPNLMSIHLDEGSSGLKSLSIRKCYSSLLDMVSAQIQSSTLEYLKLGPFLDEMDEFPFPFSSSINSFRNLPELKFECSPGVNCVKLSIPRGENFVNMGSLVAASSTIHIFTVCSFFSSTNKQEHTWMLF
ncbi:hypothetical protein POM88_040017 [Heracleum sosnowskyi]|uniref:R13L1/DRL21-like LRR repeat region domain-containing protein n=1 Tax=Heracleum sosnowskyi TaxID=360622 RepID=A0AAD8M8B6_9APIA|nr:hypothetical protein POM88_040017 [Heracleum sosnowskyi]